MHKYKFGKRYKIKSKKTFEEIIAKGNKNLIGDIFIRWMTEDSGQPQIKVAVTVPKKKYKKATDRNKIKRYLRETIRQKKDLLSQNLSNKNLYIIFTYVGSSLPKYGQVEKNISEIIDFLANNETVWYSKN